VEEESAELFSQLYKLIPDRVQVTPSLYRFLPSCSTLAMPGQAIVVHQPQSTEHYTTQVIEIHTDNASEALNSWLVSNGFSPVPEQNQRYYLIPGRAFLCVKIRKLPEGTEAQIPPVHLAWRDDKLTFPLKFSSHSGQFDADLYVLSESNLPPEQFSEWRFRRVGSAVISGSAVESSLERLAGKRALITRYNAKAFNRSGQEVTRLKSDPKIDLELLK
jgi:hypothetical protein